MRSTRRAQRVTWLANLTIIAGLLAPAATLAKAPPQEPPAFPTVGTDVLAQDSWIVTLVPGANARAEAKGLANAAGGKAGLVYEHALTGFQLKGSAKAAAALRHNPRVASVEADRPVFLTETLPIGVERIDAWTFTGDGAYQLGYRGTGARIAIIDTGIDLDHPDLAASIDNASGKNCLNASLPPNDGYGHGTHVAGTAAAPLNGEGVVGVAPEASLVAIKMFDDAGNSSEALALCALERVIELNTDADPANDIDVVNMSWGEQRAWGDCASDALHGAICRASETGAILVGGAGNNITDAGTFVPAAYPEVISVSAIADFDARPGGAAGCYWIPSLGWYDCDDTFAFFSNYGPSVDVIAPGVNVYSTWAGGGYAIKDGTSMATPHVAGTLALMAAADASLTQAEALATLRMTGECPGGAWADADGVAGCSGQGTWTDDPDGIAEPLVNAARAAAAVDDGSPPPPPPPPPPDPTAPEAPVLFSATGGVSSITLSWSTPADGGSAITGFEIWRGTSSGGETLLTTVGAVNGYDDFAVSAGTTYWYQVAAVNAVGTGPLSNELSAALVEAPSAPTLLGAPSDGMAILSWTAPADDGGAPVSAYNIYRAVGGGASTFLDSTAGETTYIDFGLSNGTEYTYRVAAVNAAGEGALSNAVAITPTAPDVITAPDPPSSLTVGRAPKGSSALVLRWSAPADDGGSPIATYFIYRMGPGDSSFSPINLVDGSTLTYTDVGPFARRSTYTYYVTAFNSYFESSPSNQVSFKSK